MVANQVEQNIDEIQQVLNTMIPQVEGGITQANQQNESLVEHLETQGRLHKSMSDAADTAIQEYNATIASARKATETMQSLSEQNESFSSQMLGDANDIKSELETAVSEMKQHCQKALGAFQTSLEEEESHLQSQVQEVSRCATECQSTTQEVITSLTQLHEQTNGHQQTLSGQATQLDSTLSEATTALTSEQNNQLQATFDESLQQVQDFLAGDLCDFESEVAEFVQELATQLKEEISGVSEQFQQQATELVDELGEYAAEQIKEEINGAFDQIIDDALNEFAEELLKAIITTQAGAATSTTLAPLVPALVAADKALQVINSVC